MTDDNTKNQFVVDEEKHKDDMQDLMALKRVKDAISKKKREIKDKDYLFLYGESNQNYADFLNDINAKAGTKFNIVTDGKDKNIDLQTIISESSEQKITVKDSSNESEIIIDTSNSDRQAQLIIPWMSICFNEASIF